MRFLCWHIICEAFSEYFIVINTIRAIGFDNYKKVRNRRNGDDYQLFQQVFFVKYIL